MEEDKDDKKKKIWDKVLMGAVIGGAIGSVVGGAVAPKGEKKEKEKKEDKKSEGLLIRVLRKVLGRKQVKQIPNEEA